jgi:hypothetical protein
VSTASIEQRTGRVHEVLAAARRIVDAADPLGREARRLLPEATGLSAPGVELALARHVETSASPDELARLLARSPEAPRVHIVLSANVFVGAVRALALAVASSPDVSVRPSSREAVMAPLIVRALIEASARARVELASALEPAPGDVVHVYGRSETIAAIAGEAPPGVRVVGHGPGFGIAFVDAEASPLDLAAERLSWDVVPFDQRGCLSPRVALVRGSPDDARAFGERLARELERRQAEVPRGELSDDERRDAALYRQTANVVGQCHIGTSFAVGVDLDPRALALPPSGRHVHVARVGGADDALRLLAPFRDAVTSVGYAGETSLLAPFVSFFGTARRLPLGRMQSPPLDGPVDLRGMV